MVHKKGHQFLAQFSIPFHMVWSVLLRVVAQKTTLWLVEIFWQPIRSFYLFNGFWSYHSQQKETHHVENCARKWCLFCVPFCLRSHRRFERCAAPWSHCYWCIWWGKNINLYMLMYMVGTSIRRNFPQIQLMIQNNSQSVTKQAWEKENLPN